MPDMEHFPVRDPRRVGDPRVERLDLDGERSAAPRSRSWTPACRSRHRWPGVAMGSGARGRPLTRCSPTSSATRITSATWTSRSPAPSDGVTALQMDIKVEGITPEIMRVALEQARDGRLHILEEMNRVIRAPRDKMSEWAPSIITLKIDPEKIRDVIGKGGAVIRQITEETGTTIDIENDGTVKIASVQRHRGPRGAAAHRADHRRRRGRAHLRGQGRAADGLRRVRHHPAGTRRPGAHLADLRRARRARQRQAARRAI